VRWVALMFAAALPPGCLDSADDCNLTASCPLPAAPSDACEGTCVPGHFSPAWSDPWLVWLGGEKPSGDLCSQVNTNLQMAFNGTVQPPTLVCPGCTCSTPSGSCEVATVTESTESCMASMPGFTFPFAPPSGWDGSCLALTSASGMAVTASMTVASVVVHDACTPQTIMDMKPPPPPPQPWSYVQMCGFAPGTCPQGGDVCEPAVPVGKLLLSLPPGLWTYCVSPATDTTATCPPEYPIGRNFGSGWSTQTCADCTCTQPVGSSCSTTDSLVTFYSDDACADDVGAVVPQSSMPMCVDVPSTSPVGSMSASVPTYMPGMCMHGGGGVVGGPPTPAEAMPLCCLE
jgi:hypothetical protein